MHSDTASSPLEQIETAVVRKSKSKVFRMSSDFPENRVILWEGEEIEDFLALADERGGGMVYLRRGVVEPGKEGLSEHQGEIFLVQAAFLCDGIFHVFEAVAPWAIQAAAPSSLLEGPDEPFKDTRADQAEAAKGLLAKLEAAESKIVSGFVESLKGEGRVVEPSGYELRHQVHRYLVEAFGFPAEIDVYQASRLSPELDKILGRILDQVGSEMRAEERMKVDALLPQCEEWARRSGLKTLSQGDVEVFLDEIHAPLSRDGRRLLWRRTNFSLKGKGVSG